jgi:hypothetical protein
LICQNKIKIEILGTDLVDVALVKAHEFAAQGTEHRFVDHSCRPVPLADERIGGQWAQHVV